MSQTQLAPHVAATDRRSLVTLAAVLGAAVVSFALRLPFLKVPLLTDEGGYAWLAQEWAAGGDLYDEVWVDRPQGLMLVYRWVMDVSPTGVGIRVAAALAGALLVVAVASCAWALAGRRAAVWTAAITAVLGASVPIDGYLLSSELLGAVCASAGIACALWWRRGAADALLVVGGALAGCGVLMKQSAFDGLVVVTVVVLASSSRSERRSRSFVLAGAGAASVGGLAMLHGALTGWSEWWYAVVGYRLNATGGIGLDRLGLLAESVVEVWFVVVPVAVAVVLTLRSRSVHPRAVQPGALLVPLSWLAVASVAFLVSPYYSRHYWLVLVGPVSLLLGVVLSRLARTDRRRAVMLVAVALLPTLLHIGWLTALSPDSRDENAMPDRRVLVNTFIAPWIEATVPEDEEVYAFAASADLYFLTQRGTEYRYLWWTNITSIEGEPERLRAWLASADGPEWIVVYQEPDLLDPSGATSTILQERYRRIALIEGYEVLRRP